MAVILFSAAFGLLLALGGIRRISRLVQLFPTGRRYIICRLPCSPGCSPAGVPSGPSSSADMIISTRLSKSELMPTLDLAEVSTNMTSKLRAFSTPSLEEITLLQRQLPVVLKVGLVPDEGDDDVLASALSYVSDPSVHVLEALRVCSKCGYLSRRTQRWLLNNLLCMMG